MSFMKGIGRALQQAKQVQQKKQAAATPAPAAQPVQPLMPSQVTANDIIAERQQAKPGLELPQQPISNIQQPPVPTAQPAPTTQAVPARQQPQNKFTRFKKLFGGLRRF